MKRSYYFNMKTLIMLSFFLGLFLSALSINAQEPLLTKKALNNGKTTLQIENANPGHWYLLYQLKKDGTYEMLDAQASSTGKIIFRNKIQISDDIVAFEYEQLPDPVPVTPDKSKLIRKQLE